jgi:hypothetical protein
VILFGVLLEPELIVVPELAFFPPIVLLLTAPLNEPVL